MYSNSWHRRHASRQPESAVSRHSPYIQGGGASATRRSADEVTPRKPATSAAIEKPAPTSASLERRKQSPMGARVEARRSALQRMRQHYQRQLTVMEKASERSLRRAQQGVTEDEASGSPAASTGQSTTPPPPPPPPPPAPLDMDDTLSLGRQRQSPATVTATAATAAANGRAGRTTCRRPPPPAEAPPELPPTARANSGTFFGNGRANGHAQDEVLGTMSQPFSLGAPPQPPPLPATPPPQPKQKPALATKPRRHRTKANGRASHSHDSSATANGNGNNVDNSHRSKGSEMSWGAGGGGAGGGRIGGLSAVRDITRERKWFKGPRVPSPTATTKTATTTRRPASKQRTETGWSRKQDHQKCSSQDSFDHPEDDSLSIRWARPLTFVLMKKRLGNLLAGFSGLSRRATRARALRGLLDMRLRVRWDLLQLTQAWERWREQASLRIVYQRWLPVARRRWRAILGDAFPRWLERTSPPASPAAAAAAAAAAAESLVSPATPPSPSSVAFSSSSSRPSAAYSSPSTPTAALSPAAAAAKRGDGVLSGSRAATRLHIARIEERHAQLTAAQVLIWLSERFVHRVCRIAMRAWWEAVRWQRQLEQRRIVMVRLRRDGIERAVSVLHRLVRVRYYRGMDAWKYRVKIRRRAEEVLGRLFADEEDDDGNGDGDGRRNTWRSRYRCRMTLAQWRSTAAAMRDAEIRARERRERALHMLALLAQDAEQRRQLRAIRTWRERAVFLVEASDLVSRLFSRGSAWRTWRLCRIATDTWIDFVLREQEKERATQLRVLHRLDDLATSVEQQAKQQALEAWRRRVRDLRHAQTALGAAYRHLSVYALRNRRWIKARAFNTWLERAATLRDASSLLQRTSRLVARQFSRARHWELGRGLKQWKAASCALAREEEKLIRVLRRLANIAFDVRQELLTVGLTTWRDRVRYLEKTESCLENLSWFSARWRRRSLLRQATDQWLRWSDIAREEAERLYREMMEARRRMIERLTFILMSSRQRAMQKAFRSWIDRVDACRRAEEILVGCLTASSAWQNRSLVRQAWARWQNHVESARIAEQRARDAQQRALERFAQTAMSVQMRLQALALDTWRWCVLEMKRQEAAISVQRFMASSFARLERRKKKNEWFGHLERSASASLDTVEARTSSALMSAPGGAGGHGGHGGADFDRPPGIDGEIGPLRLMGTTDSGGVAADILPPNAWAGGVSPRRRATRSNHNSRLHAGTAGAAADAAPGELDSDGLFTVMRTTRAPLGLQLSFVGGEVLETRRARGDAAGTAVNADPGLHAVAKGDIFVGVDAVRFEPNVDSAFIARTISGAALPTQLWFRRPLKQQMMREHHFAEHEGKALPTTPPPLPAPTVLPPRLADDASPPPSSGHRTPVRSPADRHARHASELADQVESLLAIKTLLLEQQRRQLKEEVQRLEEQSTEKLAEVRAAGQCADDDGQDEGKEKAASSQAPRSPPPVNYRQSQHYLAREAARESSQSLESLESLLTNGLDGKSDAAPAFSFKEFSRSIDIANSTIRAVGSPKRLKRVIGDDVDDVPVSPPSPAFYESPGRRVKKLPPPASPKQRDGKSLSVASGRRSGSFMSSSSSLPSHRADQDNNETDAKDESSLVLAALLKGHGAQNRRELWPRLIAQACKKSLIDLPPVSTEQMERDAQLASPETRELIDLDIRRAGFIRDMCGPVAYDSVTTALRRILGGFSTRYPEVGYTQGMDRIAATLLMYMGERTCLSTLVLLTTVLLKGYYSSDFHGVRTDSLVADRLMQQRWPEVGKAFDLSGVSIEFYSQRWFITMFVGPLPLEIAHRLWDVFFARAASSDGGSEAASSVFVAATLSILCMARDCDVQGVFSSSPGDVTVEEIDNIFKDEGLVFEHIAKREREFFALLARELESLDRYVLRQTWRNNCGPPLIVDPQTNACWLFCHIS